MKLFKDLERLEKMHRLIELGCTGTPEEFARRVGLMANRIFDIIDELKSRGAPIAYSRKAKSYYYTCDFELKVTCEFRVLSNDELRETSAGTYFFKATLFNTFFVC